MAGLEEIVKNLQKGQEGLQHPITENMARFTQRERMNGLEQAVQELSQKMGLKPPFEIPSTFSWSGLFSSNEKRLEKMDVAVTGLENLKKTQEQAKSAQVQTAAPVQNVEMAQAAARTVAQATPNAVSVDHSHDGSSVAVATISGNGGQSQGTGGRS